MTPSSSGAIEYLTNPAACASFDASTGAARRAPSIAIYGRAPLL